MISTVLALADRVGPDRVTTTAVAEAVGLTQAAVFRHFASKDDLWLAVADHIGERLRAAWDAASDGEKPSADLRALVRAQLGQIALAPALPMLLFSRELNVGNETLRGRLHGLLSGFLARLQDAARAGQAAGQLRPDIPAADVALLFASIVQGVAIRWVLGTRTFDLLAEGDRLAEIQLKLLAGNGA